MTSYGELSIISLHCKSRTNIKRPHLVFFVDLRMRALWMWGITPPPAIVALISVSSSSSPLIASCKCLGVILFTFKSLLAFPANSSTSAVRYSRMAAVYTAEVAPTLLLALTLLFKNLWILPTGNYRKPSNLKRILTCRPALADRDWGAFFDLPLPNFPPLPPFPPLFPTYG